MLTDSIQTFVVKFNNEITFREISLLRGAVLNSLGGEPELLFHNHIGESAFRYSYPLIQYKRIHKRAAIFCIGQGVEAIGQFLSAQNFSIMLGSRPVQLSIEAVSPKRSLVQTWDSTFRYHLQKWLPFNSENYREYMALDDSSSRVACLEKILIGNLISFAKGVGINLNEQVDCKLLSVSAPRLVLVKNVKMMSFDVEFRSNLSLPDYMGLGKHVSIGYGLVEKYDKENYNYINDGSNR